MTEDGLDLYADIDTFSPKAAARNDSSDDCSCNSAQTEMHTDLWMDGNEIMVLPNPNGTFTAYASNTAVSSEQKASCVKPSHLETKRIKTEMDIYFELFAEEMTNMKSKFEMVPEFQELRNEVLRLQNLNSEKDALISELTTQNISLKRNICSLYKTAKAEDAQKDLLLAEVNRKLDRFHYRKNALFRSGKDQYTQTDDQGGRDNAETKVIPRKYKGDNSNENEPQEPMKDQNISTGHKRLFSPHKEDFNTEHHTNAKQSKREKRDSNAQKTSTSSDCEMRTIEISPRSSGELNSSSDTTETNNLFFDLLPDALKHSFWEYEKSHIASLNRLKQSFVNHDFMRSKKQTSDVNGVHPSLEPDFKTPDSLIAKPYNADTSDSSKPFLKQTSDLNVSKKSTKELPSFPSVNHDDRLHDDKSKNERTENSFSMKHEKSSSYDKTKEHHTSRAPFRTKNFPPNDVMNIYMQRRERMHFLSKRRIGLYDKQMKEK